MPRTLKRKKSSKRSKPSKRSKGSKGFKGISRFYAPVGHALNATGETVGELGSTVGNVANRTIKGASQIGRIWTRHVNAAISGKKV